MQSSFDFIIIGSGSAGAVIANRLTASGKHSVLLLEAGPPDDNPWIRVPLALTRVMQKGGYAWFDPTLATQSFGGRSIMIPQGKTVGGSSSINGMLYVRGQRGDFDDWRDGGCPGWGWEDVLPYFRKSEMLERGGSDEAHGRSGELKLSWMDDLPEISRAAMQAVREYGLPFNEDINSGNQEGVGYLLATIYRGRRQSTAKAFIHPVKAKRPNLAIVTEAHVRRILVKDGRATGVLVQTPEGLRVFGANREVVLSAGAVGSPHILQHSGIGDAAHLKSVGVEPVLHSPEVGQNLQDHLFGHIKFKVGQRKWTYNHVLPSTPRMAVQLLRWLVQGKGVLATSTSHFCGFFRSSPELDRPDLQLAMRPFSFSMNKTLSEIDKFPGITISAIQTRPFSRGNVLIQSNDPMQRARIDTNYLSDDRDVEVLINGMREIRKMAAQPALAGKIVEEVEPGPPTSSEADLADYLRRFAGTVGHPTSTVRMGNDPRAPLTPRLKMKGIEGLRVADASIMPRITSGNTNAPSIMIGEKASALILEDLAAG